MSQYFSTLSSHKENIKVEVKTKNIGLLMQSKCSVCGTKKSRFVKEQDAKGLLSNFGIKTPLSKIPLLNVLFQVYKMNEIINTSLLVGDKFMPEMDLRQPEFTYSACGTQKIKKELKSLCKVVIQILFTKMSLIKHVFNMIWPMVNQKI